MYNQTLAQYQKRAVLVGLSGRLEDRFTLKVAVETHRKLIEALQRLDNRSEVEEFMRTVPNWRDLVNAYLYSDRLPLVDETMKSSPAWLAFQKANLGYDRFQSLLEGVKDRKKVEAVIRSVPNWEEIKKYMADDKMPVAVIEEIENKAETEAFIRSVPNWQPVVYYFSQNPELQDKFPLLTRESFYDFLYKNKIGYAIFGLTDHETDRFVCQFGLTKIAQNLCGRSRIENMLINGLDISHTSDSPWMFYYLKPERLKQLKSAFYEKLNQYRTQGKSEKETKEMQWFINYMVESLDGRNLQRLDEQTEISKEVTHNCVQQNMRSSELVESMKKKPAADIRKQEIKTQVTDLLFLIENGIDHMNPKEGCIQIRDAIEGIQGNLTQIKRLHHKVQQQLYMQMRRIVRLLENRASVSDLKSNVARFYLDAAYSLNEMTLSNGEQALYRRQKRMTEKTLQDIQDRQAEAQAKIRQKRKEMAHQRLREENKRQLSERTPEEIEAVEKEKTERRQRSKLRKMMKNLKRKDLIAAETPESIVTETPETVAAETPVLSVEETKDTSYAKEVRILHRFPITDRDEIANIIQKNYTKKPFYMDLISSRHKQAAVNRGIYVQQVRQRRNHSRGQ